LGAAIEEVFSSLNNSDSRPSNSLFQIARGLGATLSECTFFKKSAHHSEDFFKTAFSNNIRFKTLQLFVLNSKRLGGATLSECTFFFKKAHVTKKTSSRQTTSRPHDKKNPDRAISEFFLINNPGICSGAL
jgi:hypothetical protein